MTLTPPPLDDADAAALLAAARRALERRAGGWRADDPADPGTALLEAFAHVTAAELSRLNALPRAAEMTFLSLIGAAPRPAEAARTILRFSVPAARASAAPIPRGARIAAAGDPAMVFVTLHDAELPAGALHADVPAAQIALALDEPVGTGTGAPGQRLRLRHRPLPARAPGDPAGPPPARILVSVGPDGPPPGARTTRREGVLFTVLDEGADVAVDSASGAVVFPLSGPFIPHAGAQIRADYPWLPDAPLRPLPAGALSEPLDPLPGLSVANPAPVSAGMAAETADQTIARGADAMLAGGAATRPRDYEAIARNAHRAVARAHASARSERWMFARPGAVDVAIAPHLAPGPLGAVTPEIMAAAAGPDGPGPLALAAVTAALDGARPLGVSVAAHWIRLKAVGVSARLHAAAGTDHDALRDAAQTRLNALLRPTPDPAAAGGWPDGWPLGRALRLSEVIETLAATPGVRAADRVTLRPRDPMQGRVTAISADCAQPGVWYAAIGGRLHRTLDDGAGWNAALDGGVLAVAAHPLRTGVAAAVGADGVVRVTFDCGRSFRAVGRAAFAPTGITWADGAERARLILSGPGDLAELSLPDPAAEADPDAPLPHAQGLLGSDGPVGPVWACAGAPDGRGGRRVAAARRGLGGVLLSNDSGWDGGFEIPAEDDDPDGRALRGADIRALAFVQDGARTFLLAGGARPPLPGLPVWRLAEVDADACALGPWRAADDGWTGGGVAALAAHGARVIAGAWTDGLLAARIEDGALVWRRPGAESGLPDAPSGQGRAGICALAMAPRRKDGARPAMAGGDGPLLLTRDADALFAGPDDAQFADVADRHGADRVAIPADWAICADAHAIEVTDHDG